MKYSKLIASIDKFVEINKTFFPDLEVNHTEANEYLVKNRWDNESPTWFRKNGVYYHLSKTEDVIYIGKADQEIGEGIGNRACGPINCLEEKKLYSIDRKPNGPVNDELQNDISQGNFFIAASVVTPSYLSCLIEVFALTICMKLEGDIPYFNNKIC